MIDRHLILHYSVHCTLYFVALETPSCGRLAVPCSCRSTRPPLLLPLLLHTLLLLCLLPFLLILKLFPLLLHLLVLLVPLILLITPSSPYIFSLCIQSLTMLNYFRHFIIIIIIIIIHYTMDFAGNV